jgi:hypothetical protein
MSRLIASAAAAAALCLASPAWAQPSVDQQVDAIYNAWAAMDTPQNRALAAKRGAPLEAALSSRWTEELPAVKGKGSQTQYPLFQPVDKRPPYGEVYAGGGTMGRFTNSRGIATALITKDGMAMREYRGGKATHFVYTDQPNVIGVLSRSGKIKTTKPRPVYWPIPKWVARRLPGLAKKVGEWRAKRMIRAAVKVGQASVRQRNGAIRTGQAPSVTQVKLGFHRATRTGK